MTAGQALSMADTLFVNTIKPGVKKRWLCELEAKIATELFGRAPDAAFALAERIPDQMPLTAPPAYEKMYWLYLIYLAGQFGDAAAPFAAKTLFEECYADYAKWVQRTKGAPA